MSHPGQQKLTSLLFHYHTKIFVDNEGGLWLPSSLGLWLEELATHFEKVALIHFEAPHKNESHDYRLSGNNIQLESLGENKGYTDFFSKRKKIKKAAERLNNKFDYLLIRGITPYQDPIWNAFKVNKGRAFLLVRNLTQPRQIHLTQPLTIAAYLGNKVRELRFRKIIETSDVLFSNSQQVIKEVQGKTGETVTFASTNVLKGEYFSDFAPKTRQAVLELLFVGRISAMKGVDELIQALHSIKNTYPEKHFKLNLVGDGEREYIEQVQKKLSELDLKSNVEFYGRLPFGPKLFTLYQQSDLMVLPSYTEGFPRVVWEAGLFSTPVIVTSVGGIPDVLTNNKHALLIEPKSSKSLVIALENVITSEEEAIQRAENLYALALQNTLEKGVEVIAEGLKRI